MNVLNVTQFFRSNDYRKIVLYTISLCFLSNKEQYDINMPMRMGAVVAHMGAVVAHMGAVVAHW